MTVYFVVLASQYDWRQFQIATTGTIPVRQNRKMDEYIKTRV